MTERRIRFYPAGGRYLPGFPPPPDRDRDADDEDDEEPAVDLDPYRGADAWSRIKQRKDSDR